MTNTSKTRLGIAALAALMVAASEPGPAPGTPAPDFELRDIAGKSVRLSSFNGEVVILHFWATWCPICLKEMPLLESLSREKSLRGLRILAVNLGEPRRKVIRYLDSHHLDLPVLLDSRGDVAASYGVLGLPASVVVDPSGRVAEGISMGSLDREKLVATLAPLLKEGEKGAGGEGRGDPLRKR